MKNEKGFTLVELLVVVAIIGILAAIAIPQFEEYRQRGFDSRAQTNLRNAITGQEAYYVDNESYLVCPDIDVFCEGTLPGYENRDDLVTLAFEVSDDGQRYAGGSCHNNGSQVYAWQSFGANAGAMESTAIDSDGCSVTVSAS